MNRARWNLRVKLFQGGTPWADCVEIENAINNRVNRMNYVYWLLLLSSWALTACAVLDMYYQRRENREWKAMLKKEWEL